MKKKVCLLLAAALVLAVMPALADETVAKPKTHDMTVEFVSFDATAKTVTFKNDKGESKTAPAMAPALTALATMKAGDKVTFTCADNEKGEHQGVAMAKPAGAPKHG